MRIPAGPARVAPLALGGLCLLAGLDAALLLLGLPAPVTTDRLPDVHGPLLVLGFVGTVVALERAVALRRRAALAAPLLLGGGSLATLTPAPLAVGTGVVALGTEALLLTYAALWRRQGSPALAVQALGAVLAAGAGLLWWAGVPVPVVLPWLVGFVVLTIAGERLELARVALPGQAAEHRVVAAAALVLAATVTALVAPAGVPLLGVALVALVVLLVRYDVARSTVRSQGLPRYVAWCLLAGYGWLLVAGGVWALGAGTAGASYDAVAHAVLLGFTLSMIMAHAPVVLPAVLGVAVPYRPALYGPVVLLHASLALRLVGGDAYGAAWALTLGGLLNVVAVLAFAALAVHGAVAARSSRSGRTSGTGRTRRGGPGVDPGSRDGGDGTSGTSGTSGTDGADAAPRHGAPTADAGAAR